MDWYRRVDSEQSRRVEPNRRRAGAALIRDFVSGKITNDQLEEGWPLGPGDPALNGLFDFVWRFYDDLSTHQFHGRPNEAEELLRCARFLESELPYVWRAPVWTLRAVAAVLGVATLGLANRLWDVPDCWPFPSREAGS